MVGIARPGVRGAIVSVVGAVMLVTGIVGAFTLEWAFWMGPSMLVGAGLAYAPWHMARGRAQARRTERVLTAWGAERGLVYQRTTGNPRTTPALKKGGGITHVLVGEIGGDPQGFLAHYTYHEGSGKNRVAVQLSLAVARFEGREGLRVRICPQEWRGSGGIFDDWKDFASSSVEVDERYAIEAREGHDPVQVLELLDPVTMASLLDTAIQPVVEIDEGTLLIMVGGHVGISPGVDDLAWFDLLRAQADTWGARIAGI